MMKNDLTFVYVLQDPRDKSVRYVGATVDPDARMNQHKNKPTNKKMESWVSELKEQGLCPEMTVVDWAKRERALEIESSLIWLFSKVSKEKLYNGGSVRLNYRFFLHKPYSVDIECAECMKCGALHNLGNFEDDPIRSEVVVLENPVNPEKRIYICAECGELNKFRHRKFSMDWNKWWTQSY